MRTGVLALQGDVPEHLAALARIGAGPAPIAVRAPADLAAVDALFLPGGESTTMSVLLQSSGLDEALAKALADGLPAFGTCAGLILLARRLEPGRSGRDPPTLEFLDVTVRRNDYGSQVDSFEEPIRVDGLPDPPFPGVFIRAPRILAVGPDATPIAWRGEEVVGVRSGKVWGLTFHPELSADFRLHERFLAAAEARA